MVLGVLQRTNAYWRRLSPLWASATICVVFIFFSILWSKQQRLEERQLLANAIEKEMSFGIASTAEGIEVALVSLRRMAQRWEVRGEMPQVEWRRDAENYVNDVTALTTIEWVDRDYTVQWVEPLVGNEKAVGLYIAYDQERHQLLENAKQVPLTLSPPLDLVQGYRAVITYVPIHIDQQFNGFIVGIFRLEALLANSFSHIGDSDFEIHFFDGDKELFHFIPTSSVVYSFAQEKTFTVFDRTWQMRLAPTEEFVNIYITQLPTIVLWLGCMLSLFAGLLVFAAIRSYQHSVALKEKSNQLIESEGRVRAVFDNAFDGLITIDRQGIVQSYNEACCRIFGYAADEIVGNNIKKLMPAPYHNEHDGYIDNYHKTGKKKIIGINREVRGLKKSGEEFPLELSVSEVNTASGKIYSGIIRDLSERKRSEDALISMGRVLEQSINEIYIFDAITLRFIFVNKGARKNIGYDMDELSRLTPIDIKPDYTRKSFLKLIASAKSMGDEECVFNTRHQRKNASTYDVEVHLQPVDYKGKDAFLAIILDVTERTKMEEEKAEILRVLEESNKELEEFAYRTSHDLRSPLVSSIQLISLAEKAIADGNYERATQSILHTQTSLVKLEALVRDILELTKTKNASEELQCVNIDEIVGGAIEKIAYMDNFSRITINKNMHLSEPVWLKKGRIVMIVENLLSNAVKYQDLQESAPYINITACQQDSTLVLSVEDNGLGIPEHQQDKLFSMFKRFHSQVSFGSGLGLYMVKKSAEVLGGRIEFEAWDKGSIFRLIVPLDDNYNDQS